MTFNDLMTVNIEEEINTIFGSDVNDSKLVRLFQGLWRVELLQYANIEVLIDEQPTINAYKAMLIQSFLKHKANLTIWMEIEKFKNIRDFKKVHTQLDNRTTKNNSSSNMDGVFNEGYSGYGQVNGEFRQDTTRSNNTNTFNSTDGFNRTLTDDDPELAARVLKTNMKIEIQLELKNFILQYGKVLI